MTTTDKWTPSTAPFAPISERVICNWIYSTQFEDVELTATVTLDEATGIHEVWGTAVERRQFLQGREAHEYARDCLDDIYRDLWWESQP